MGRRGRTRIAALALGAGLVTAAAGPVAQAQLPLFPPATTAPTPTTPAAAPPVTPTGGLPDSTTHAGGDATRRGAITGGGLKPPLRPLWRLDFSALVSRVVVGDGRAYVVSGGRVTAIELQTGRKVWTSALDGIGDLSFGAGKLVTIGNGGLVALDAATGATTWTAQSTDSSAQHGSSPTIAGDLVLLQGQGLSAYDLGTGARRWRGGTSDGTNGEPAVSGDRIFQYGGCTVAAVDRRNGGIIWTRNRGCTGGGGGRVVLDGDRAYTPEFNAVAASDGADRPEPRLDIVAGDTGLQLRDGLAAIDVASGRLLWKSKVDDSQINDTLGATLPVGSTVFQTRFEGTVRARDLRTGTVTWEGRLRRAKETFTGSSSASDFALGAGGGVLVVLRGSTVDALASAGAAPKALTITVPQRRFLDAADTATIVGKASGDLLPTPRVEADPFPFGRFRATGRKLAVGEKGRVEGRLKVDRNTRVRLAGVGGSSAPTRAYTIFAYARTRFSVRNVNNRVTTRIRVTGSSAIRFRGRRVHLYFGDASKRRLRKLGSARMTGPAKRRGAGTVRFAAIRGAGSRDFLYACVPAVHKLGQGAPDVVQRRCGRASIRY